MKLYRIRPEILRALRYWKGKIEKAWWDSWTYQKEKGIYVHVPNDPFFVKVIKSYSYDSEIQKAIFKRKFDINGKQYGILIVKRKKQRKRKEKKKTFDIPKDKYGIKIS